MIWAQALRGTFVGTCREIVNSNCRTAIYNQLVWALTVTSCINLSTKLNIHAFEVDKRQDNDDSGGQYSNDCGCANDDIGGCFKWLAVHHPGAALWLALSITRKISKEVLRTD